MNSQDFLSRGGVIFVAKMKLEIQDCLKRQDLRSRIESIPARFSASYSVRGTGEMSTNCEEEEEQITLQHGIFDDAYRVRRGHSDLAHPLTLAGLLYLHTFMYSRWPSPRN